MNTEKIVYSQNGREKYSNYSLHCFACGLPKSQSLMGSWCLTFSDAWTQSLCSAIGEKKKSNYLCSAISWLMHVKGYCTWFLCICTELTQNLSFFSFCFCIFLLLVSFSYHLKIEWKEIIISLLFIWKWKSNFVNLYIDIWIIAIIIVR